MIMMTRTKQLLLLLLLVSTSSAKANPLKKMFGSRQQQKAMDDAAGGASTKTCDANLANSLVKAHDLQAKAEGQRDASKAESHMATKKTERLLAEYASTKTTLDDRIAELELMEAQGKDRLEKRQRELDNYVKAAEDKLAKLVAKHEEALRQTQAWWVAKAEDTDKAFLVKEAAGKQEADASVQLTETALQAKIVQLESDISTLSETNTRQVAALHAEAATSMSNQERALNSKHDKKQAELEATKKMAEEERLTLLREKEEHANMLISDLDMNKKTLEDEHNSVVSTLKIEMATKEKEAIATVRAKEEELETKMEVIKKEAQHQLDESKGQHSKEMTKLVASIKAMEKDHDDLETKMTQMGRQYKEAAREIDEWQELYQARSYCNFTHMQEDTTASLAAATKVASDQLTVAGKAATEKLSVAGKVATEKLSVAGKVASEQLKVATKAAEPTLQKGRALYDQHLKETIDKHVLPIHEAHVKPALRTASKTVKVATVEAENYVDAAYQRLVMEFQNTCPSLKANIRDANFPPAMLKFVHAKCQDPQNTVNRFLLTILAVVCFIFRRFLWRSLLAVLYLPFYILWYLTPLPLIFPAHIKKENNLEDDQSENAASKRAVAKKKVKKEKLSQ
eukprot:CAMPEP_0119031478 /NCGR_PEP_ID=MMETSP1176-20130426/41565_1 /TAXON_ID=265551 /ORGANISM="Synedropsis recta cf, Strain CCMP1620" /LENGTH=626 /DNA_ID=CAMNT_0006987873 /DNA_START=33 /DNA_END=1913 /DNA_ORIENTATION=-